MRSKPGFAAPLVVLALFVMPLAYVGAYLALLQPMTRLRMRPDGVCREQRMPAYRCGGEFARHAFSPLSLADQLIRPQYWDAD